MLEKRFANEVRETMVRHLLPRALAEESRRGTFKAAADPVLENVEEKPDGGLDIVAQCSVLPDIPALALDSYKRKAPKVEVGTEIEKVAGSVATTSAKFSVSLISTRYCMMS